MELLPCFFLERKTLKTTIFSLSKISCFIVMKIHMSIKLTCARLFKVVNSDDFDLLGTLSQLT